MAAGLTFRKTANDTTDKLSEVKIITLQDKTGNQYTLNVGDDLRLEYTPKNGSVASHTIDGFGKAIEAIIGTKDSATDTQTIFQKALATPDLATAVLGSKNGNRSLLAEEIKTTVTDNADFKKAVINKITSENLKTDSGFMKDLHHYTPTEEDLKAESVPEYAIDSIWSWFGS